MKRICLVATAALLLGGCYHAIINTGITPGPEQIHQPWAMSFVEGLVPPPTVEAMEKCGSAGVARVETQHSFLNLLVGAVTVGIVTPMDILVTCGEKSGENLALTTTRAEVEQALSSGKPFLVKVP